MVKSLITYVFGREVWKKVQALEGRLNPEDTLWQTLREKVDLVDFQLDRPCLLTLQQAWHQVRLSHTCMDWVSLHPGMEQLSCWLRLQVSLDLEVFSAEDLVSSPTELVLVADYDIRGTRKYWF